MKQENIEQLYKKWLSLQPLQAELQQKMDQQFMIDFNYNSNHLEGNTLTYGQTKLLLLFGKVKGEGLIRDFEEMKAHNVGLEMMKIEALDRKRPLSESFIRELNRTILAGDFYKVSSDGEYRYKIHTGVYKTRPNSVITPSGEQFDYASPEETPALMYDLITWYNTEEKAGNMSVIELSALFHYRYIRIHPFEDGNGRIARLLVNYILLRHGYPMIVIPSADRRYYLDALGKCDAATGKEPFNGVNATIEQTIAFVDFISFYVERKLTFALQLYRGEITEIIETNKKDIGTVNGTVNDTVSMRILNIIETKPGITVNEIVGLTGISRRTVIRRLNTLKSYNRIERIGSDKTGSWKIIK
ncbi:MAG: Fic family protein [Prevotellaceae bacterium]|nr:Fic family protein [Prevotellaceae bacterium]